MLLNLIGGLAALALGVQGGPPQPALRFLDPARIDPVRLLPPPPPEGSPTQKEELAELRRLQVERSAQAFAKAAWNAEHEDATALAPAMGPAFQLDKLPATARLLADVRAEQALISKLAKAEFHRIRPWVVDPAIVGCSHGDDKAKSAYPSGHATMAYALAVVMADLDPPHAQAVLAQAADYAHDRLVCGAHFRSDIVAGQAMGTAIGIELLQSPDLKPELDAARAELRRASPAAP